MIDYYYSNVNTYRMIVNHNFKNYLEVDKKLEELSNHKSLLGNDYYAFHSEYSNKRTEYAMICIVFEVMTVEAFYNEYITLRLNQKNQSIFKKLSLKEKVEQATELITSKEFPKDSEAYISLKKLIRTRKQLVHFKVKKTSKKELTYLLDRLEKGLVRLQKPNTNEDKAIIHKILFAISTDELTDMVSTYDKIINQLRILDAKLDSNYFKTVE